jgi:hypothetical protein
VELALHCRDNVVTKLWVLLTLFTKNNMTLFVFFSARMHPVHSTVTITGHLLRSQMNLPMATSWNVQIVLERHWRGHVNSAQKRYVTKICIFF